MLEAPKAVIQRGPARRLLALMKKEFLQILRDPSAMLIAFVLPMILLFIFGFGVSLDTDRVKIGLVVERMTPSALDLASAFRGSRYFDVTMGQDRRQFESSLVDGDISGIVVIPATFSADFDGRNNPQVQVIVDGSDPNTANFVQNYAQGAVETWMAQKESKEGEAVAPITPQIRLWFNPQLSSRYFLVPGSVAIVLTLVGTLLTSLVVAREWERGTMEAVMATPVAAFELLLGKVIPYFLLAMASATVCLALSIYVFEIPFRGSLLAFYLLSACFLAPALGQGLLISAAFKNQFTASQAALMSAFLPAFLLSGFLFEINSMPRPIQWITTIVPARYFIPTLQTVFLVGDVWSLFLSNIAMMLIIGAVLFFFAAINMKKRLS